MDTKRILGAALSAIAATSVLGVTPAQATHRHVSRPAVVWADFQRPAAWDNPNDTLHYYVMSPVVTKQMVGKVATSAITSVASIDCKGFNAGYAGPSAWVSVPFTVKSCTSTTATVTYRITKAMVGQRVSVIGWTATSATSATVVGRFRVGTSSSTVSVTAQRAAAEVPVGPQTSLGSWNGKDVSIASGGGVNEIWVGDTKYSAPEGTVAHVDLAGSVVNLWIQGATSMDQWKLDLATGKATTQSIPMVKLVSQGKPGFTIETGVPVMYGTRQDVYGWDGVKRTSVGSYGSVVLGYTDTAFVLNGGYRVEWLSVLDLDGTTWGGINAPAPGSYFTVTLIAPDRVEVTPKWGPTPQHCVITKQAGTTCSPA